MDDSGYADYDHSRLGGTAAKRPADTFLATVINPVAVHVFNEKVVIVGNDGVVTELERALCPSTESPATNGRAWPSWRKSAPK